MKIVLIGYRASGKSTLGPVLSEQLGWPLYDVDGDIQKRYGCSLTEAFNSDEDAYRDVETDVVETLCGHDQCVIAFGAGSILRPQNQVVASRDSLVVYLKLDAAELWRRAEATSTAGNVSSLGLRRRKARGIPQNWKFREISIPQILVVFRKFQWDF